MHKTEKLFLAILAAFLLSPLFFTNCGKKNEKLPGGTITVLDSFTNQPVVNAKVRLHLDSQNSPVTGSNAVPPKPDYRYTDSYGQATWTLKYPASYFAEVTSTFSSDVSTKLITFRKNQTTEVTIWY